MNISAGQEQRDAFLISSAVSKAMQGRDRIQQLCKNVKDDGTKLVLIKWRVIGSDMVRADSAYLERSIQAAFASLATSLHNYGSGYGSHIQTTYQTEVCVVKHFDVTLDFDSIEFLWQSLVRDNERGEVTTERNEEEKESTLLSAWKNLSPSERSELLPIFQKVAEEDYRKIVFGDKKESKRSLNAWLSEKAGQEMDVELKRLMANAIQYYVREKGWTLTMLGAAKHSNVPCTLTTQQHGNNRRFVVRESGDSTNYLAVTTKFPSLTIQ